MIYVIGILIVLLISMAVASWSSAPFVPTRTKDLSRILDLTDLKKGQIFCDMGCGNGKVVKYVAQNTRAKAIGIEMALPVFVWAKAKQIFSGLKNYKIIYKNFFKADLTDVDVAYIFGYPATLKKKIAEKLKKDLKKGAKVISYAFEIPNWTPIKKSQPNEKDFPIYLYKK